MRGGVRVRVRARVRVRVRPKISWTTSCVLRGRKKLGCGVWRVGGGVWEAIIAASESEWQPKPTGGGHPPPPPPRTYAAMHLYPPPPSITTIHHRHHQGGMWERR